MILIYPLFLSFYRGAIKKPVGILHVKVVRALKLLKMDFLGTSDPYVKLSLSGERLPAKKTTIKKNNLNPEWNEKFKLIVKEPDTQVLQLEVFDWDKVFSLLSVFICLENKGKRSNYVEYFLLGAAAWLKP